MTCISTAVSKQFEYVLIVVNKYVRYWYLSVYTYVGCAAIPDPVSFSLNRTNSRYGDTLLISGLGRKRQDLFEANLVYIANSRTAKTT